MPRRKTSDIDDFALSRLPTGKVPLPRREKKRLLQADVELNLYTAVRQEMERRGLSMRQVIRWGLQNFLVEASKDFNNPI